MERSFMITSWRNISRGILLVLLVAGVSRAQYSSLDWKLHNVGQALQLVTNLGSLDNDPVTNTTNELVNYPGLIFCEMPPGSNEEHLIQGGIWIGGITPQGDTLVSVTRTHFTPHEFFPSSEPWDTIWVVSEHDSVDIPYWSNYHGVSDQDFVCRYGDYHVLNIANDNHVPLYVDVIQRSYAWSSYPNNQYIVFNYDVIPQKIELSKVFVGFWLHGEIGNADVANNFIDENSIFFPTRQLAIAEDNQGGEDGTAISPIAIKILEPVDSSKIFTMRWYNHEDLNGYGDDALRYREAMSSGLIMQDRPEPERAHISVCFGPFETVSVGDTLHFELAEVFDDYPGAFGFGRHGPGIDSLLHLVDNLEILKGKDYKLPFPPPKPQFQATISSNHVTLNWKPQPGGVNPETYRDPYRGDKDEQPFEGYRLYKSTHGKTGPWTLLAEYDVPDDNFNNNIGLQWEFTDTGLLDYFQYYYSVTAFSKPDAGPPKYPSQESSINANAIAVTPGTAPKVNEGKVAVVPNPYRGDIAYDKYDPKWEQPPDSRQIWLEQDRKILFINLPQSCEIKIYTLAGDLVKTLFHNDPDNGFEGWNLTSSVGQAISSGIYLFTVENRGDGGVQVGKFVIIK